MSTGKTVNGKWYASFRYTDWQGNTKQKKKEGFKTEREAKQFEREFLLKQTSSPDMTFGSLCDFYFEDCKARLKLTTFNNKKTLITRHVLPYFENMPINKITPTAIRKWQNALITCRDGYSQTYLKTINNQASAIFNFAIKYYNLESNPVRACGSMGRKHADGIKFWTFDEFSRFIDRQKDNEPYYTIYNLLYYSGMRSGEMFALTLKDFDFVGSTVNIDKSLAIVEGDVLIHPPKTPKSKRVILLPEKVSGMVENYVSMLYGIKPDDRVFSISKSVLQKSNKALISASGNNHITIHGFRHSHASHLIELGFSPLLISERLGHEDIETTLRTYSHLYPNKHSEVADTLNSLMK